jgi:hypothetical protein
MIKKLLNPLILAFAGIVIYYATGAAMAIASIFGNIVVWGRWNIFGYIMPFYPFVAALLIGHFIGRYRVNRIVGIVLTVLIPALLAMAEGMYFHAAFMTVIMHPVPRFAFGIPTLIYFPLLVGVALAGYRLGRRRSSRG